MHGIKNVVDDFVFELLRVPYTQYGLYCERSELLIDAASVKILSASDSEHRPRRGRVRLGYRDPSGER